MGLPFREGVLIVNRKNSSKVGCYEVYRKETGKLECLQASNPIRHKIKVDGQLNYNVSWNPQTA